MSACSAEGPPEISLFHFFWPERSRLVSFGEVTEKRSAARSYSLAFLSLSAPGFPYQKDGIQEAATILRSHVDSTGKSIITLDYLLFLVEYLKLERYVLLLEVVPPASQAAYLAMMARHRDTVSALELMY